MKKEEWKVIEGFEDYQVSSLGRVKSLPKEICNPRRCYISKEKILKLNKFASGYLQVGLTFDKKRLTFNIHQLVAMSFLGHKPCGMDLVIDHINNDKLDNRVENLQIITQRENNSKDRKNKTSKYTGVTWHKKSNKWMACIGINGKKIYLGYFTNELEASEVYINKLKQIEK